MKTYIRTASVLAGLIALLTANSALADLTVGNFTLVNSKRVGRTIYEYTYTAVVSNNDGVDYTGVSATFTSTSSDTVIIDDQISFPDVAAGTSVAGNDTFSFRQNRSYAFNWDDLVWTVSGTPQYQPVEKTIGGTVVGGAPMVGTVNIKDSSNPPRFSYSGIGIDGTYTLNIDSDWQPPFLLWAEGYVGGIHSTMLSYVDLTVDEISKVCNITPATTAIVASAMAVQVENIDPITAPVPAADSVNDIKASVQFILQEFFAVFGLPDTFDLFESPIVLGQGSDLMFDAETFATDVSANVSVASKSDPSIELIITDATTPNDAGILLQDAQESQAAIEQFRNYFITLYDLYKDAPADLATLQIVIRPWCADGLVHTGSYGADDMLAIWAFDPTRGPAVGREFVSCSVYRPMQVQYYGLLPIHEMPDSHIQGLWVKLTYRQSGLLFNGLVSFVDVGGGIWRFYGNRRPFVSGGRVRARGERYISSIKSTVYEHGLHFWADDVGNSAQIHTGMTHMAIFNPAMPAAIINGLNTNCLRLARRQGGLSTEYGITNVPTQYNSTFYRHRGDGAANDLDLASLAAQGSHEFVFIGLDDMNQPVYVWPRLLRGLPQAMDELINNAGNYFATQLEPAGFDDIHVPGVTSISWNPPLNDDLIPGFSKLQWYNNDWLLQEIYMYNPANYGPLDFHAFVGADHDASAYPEGVRLAEPAVYMYHPASQSEYRTLQQHGPWPANIIEAREGQVFFDVQKSYIDNTLSNRMNARIRSVDRSVIRIESDVVVNAATASGIGTDSRLEVRLLYQPDEDWGSNGNTDLFIASAMVRFRDGYLHAAGYVEGYRNADASEQYAIPAPVGSYPFMAPLDFGDSHTLAAEFDAGTQTLRIEFDGQMSAFDMSGVPAFDPANFKAAEIRTRVTNINNPGDSGSIQVRCDNVRIDGLPYDDFNSGLGVNKWWIRAYE